MSLESIPMALFVDDHNVETIVMDIPRRREMKVLLFVINVVAATKEKFFSKSM